MPVIRLPVQHKFGIVSLDKAEQLLAECRENSERRNTSRPSFKASSLVEITAKFISKYNSTPEHERQQMDGVVRRALLHAKYKVGLHQHKPRVPSPASTPSPPHPSSPFGGEVVDNSGAWLELILICQCCGGYQEESLMYLATSLNYSPLSAAHIPSLFYVAGLCYQWIKSDIVSGQLLRSGELLLLRILYLLCLRLFHHHLTGTLQDVYTQEEVRQLKFDIEGFENREKAYRNFPEALLHWKVAIEVGLLLCEAYQRPLHEPGAPSQSPIEEPSQPVSSKASKPGTSTSKGHCGHAFSPMLWHVVDVWQGMKQGTSLDEGIEDLLACSTEFSSSNWIEGVLAMHILCAGAEMNISLLYLVQSLADGSGRLPYLSETPRPHQSYTEASDSYTQSDVHPGTNSDSASHTKKGTRFKLPVMQSKKDPHPSLRRTKTSSTRSTLSGLRNVETLNMLGIQPGFKEPQPHSEKSIAEEEQSISATSSYTERHEDDACSSSSGEFVERENVERNLLDLKLGPPLELMGGIRSPHQGQMSSTTIGTQSMLSGDTALDMRERCGSSHGNTVNTSRTNFESETTEMSAKRHSGSVQHRTSKTKSVNLPDASVSGGAHSASWKKHQSGSSSADSDKLQRAPPEGGASLANFTMRTVFTPIEEKLEGLRSPLGETVYGADTLGDCFQFIDPTGPVIQKLVGIGSQSFALSIPARAIDTRCTHYTHSTDALSGGAGVPGSHLVPSTIDRRSELSTPQTVESRMLDSSVFESWPSEVMLAYTLNMASVAIYGRTSLIQKAALEGKGAGGSARVERRYGLLQLAEFTHERSVDDSTLSPWSVRHCALLGLARVCSTCSHLAVKDGMSDTAWAALMKRHSSETDERVLEAYKLSKACPDLDSLLLSTGGQPLSSPLVAHIADSLSQLFLPSDSPGRDLSVCTPLRRSTMKKTELHLRKRPEQSVKPRVDDRLRPNQPIIADFETRTMGALNKIAEEHWRRQMAEEEAKG